MEYPNGPVDIGVLVSHDAFAMATRTRNDLLAAAQKRTKQDGGKVTQWGFGWLNGFYQPWVWANGGVCFDKVLYMTKCLLDEPKSVGGLQWFADLGVQQKVTPTPSGSKGINIQKEFFQGPVRFPLLAAGSSEIRFIPAVDFQWSVVPLATGPAGNNGSITWSGGTCIAKGSAVQDAAWQLILDVWGPKRDLAAIVATGTLPTGYQATFFDPLLTSQQEPILPGYAS